MDEKTKAYFKKSAVQYSKGDVEMLVDPKKDFKCAGPLLATVLNGIDSLGGMCYDFSPYNSRTRSVNFMIEKMGVPKSLAEFLYSAVRCGIVHQGMPKIGLRFFLESDRLDQGKVFYKDNKGWIYLNVSEFAFSYLDAVGMIAADPSEYIKFHPQPDDKEKNKFDEAINEIKDNIGILNHKKEEFMEEKKLERGEIQYMSSSSAYTPDNVQNLEIIEELLPED